MTSISRIVGFVFVLCGLANGQVSKCPIVTLNSPNGVALPGDQVSFKVKVDSKTEEPTLKYTWTLNRGTIITGQNTSSIEIRLPADDAYTVDVSATVTIKGLPAGCAATFSERFQVAIDPGATKLDTFIGQLERKSDQRIKEIVDVIKAEKNSQLYMIVYDAEQNRRLSIKRNGNLVTRQMKLSGVDPRRLTIIFYAFDRRMVVVWLVPPGVSSPLP